MKFDYPPRGIVKYPSVTRVLDKTMSQDKKDFLEKWKARIGEEAANAILIESQRKGEALHTLAERFLLQQPLEQENDNFLVEDKQSFNVMKIMLRNVTEVYGIETTLYSNVLQVTGRADLICRYKGKEAVVDFKTSRRMKSEEDIFDYKLQATFYGIAHNELFQTEINKGIVLMVTNDGTPLEFVFRLDDYYEPLIERIEKYYNERKV